MLESALYNYEVLEKYICFSRNCLRHVKENQIDPSHRHIEISRCNSSHSSDMILSLDWCNTFALVGFATPHRNEWMVIQFLLIRIGQFAQTSSSTFRDTSDTLGQQRERRVSTAAQWRNQDNCSVESQFPFIYEFFALAMSPYTSISEFCAVRFGEIQIIL